MNTKTKRADDEAAVCGWDEVDLSNDCAAGLERPGDLKAGERCEAKERVTPVRGTLGMPKTALFVTLVFATAVLLLGGTDLIASWL